MRKRIIAVTLTIIMGILSLTTGVFANGEEAAAAPTNLKAYSGYNRVTLEWTKSNAKTYVIQRAVIKRGSSSRKLEGFSTIGNSSSNSFVDKKAAQDTLYVYRVYADSVGGNYAEIEGRSFWKIHYSFKFRTKRTLTSHTGGKVKATFKKNTKKEAIDFKSGRYVFMYKGRKYYVRRISTYKQKISSMDNKNKHSVREATDFVNQKGLKSRTKNLIFINTYTQQEYIFKGKKGKWVCIKSWPISTGRPSTPTGTGLTRIKRKWPSANGIPYWNALTNFSIHGLPSGAPINFPSSGACVRNYNKNAKWIYKNCKIGTAVMIY